MIPTTSTLIRRTRTSGWERGSPFTLRRTLLAHKSRNGSENIHVSIRASKASAMIVYFYRRFSVLFLAACSLASAQAAELQKVWERNLAPSVRTAEGHEVSQMGVTALRFSPDGTRVAVAVEGYLRSDASRLLIVDIQNSRSPIQQFVLNVETGADDSDHVLGRPPAISWSPSGGALIAGEDLMNVESGVKCAIPGIGAAGWLSADQAIAYGRGKPNRLEFFDSHCNSDGTWNLGSTEWHLLDVSSNRGTLALLQATSTARKYSAELVVANATSTKTIQRWPELATGYVARFADSGKILCAGEGGDYSAPPEIHPRCMDVDTGKQIAEATHIMGGVAFASAEHAARIVASDHRASWNFLYHEADTVLKRRVVWDVKDNVEIVSWKPKMQVYDVGNPKPIKRPYMFAISPDGRYIAEGGNGMLSLYKLEAGSAAVASKFFLKPLLH
jgi:hypothetical protein